MTHFLGEARLFRYVRDGLIARGLRHGNTRFDWSHFGAEPNRWSRHRA